VFLITGRSSTSACLFSIVYIYFPPRFYPLEPPFCFFPTWFRVSPLFSLCDRSVQLHPSFKIRALMFLVARSQGPFCNTTSSLVCMIFSSSIHWNNAYTEFYLPYNPSPHSSPVTMPSPVVTPCRLAFFAIIVFCPLFFFSPFWLSAFSFHFPPVVKFLFFFPFALRPPPQWSLNRENNILILSLILPPHF